MKLSCKTEGIDISVENPNETDIYQTMDLVFQLLQGIGFHTDSIFNGIEYMYTQYCGGYVGAPGADVTVIDEFVGVAFEGGDA